MNEEELCACPASPATASAPPSGVKPQEGLEQSRSPHGARPWSDGPWFVEEMETRKRQYLIRCQNGIQSGGNGMVVVKGIELDHDARLIAAAPDTYEATETAHEFAAMFLAFVGRDQGTTGIDKTLDDLSEMAVTLDAKARAALAKARGE